MNFDIFALINANTHGATRYGDGSMCGSMPFGHSFFRVDMYIVHTGLANRHAATNTIDCEN